MAYEDVRQRRPIEEMSHAEAASELVGQVVRQERDRANRNRDSYDQQVKLASAQIHALLAIEEGLTKIHEALEEQ